MSLMSKIRSSIALRLSVITLSMILLLSVVVTAMCVINYKKDIEGVYEMYALNTSFSISGMIDVDRLKEIIDTGEKTEYYD